MKPWSEMTENEMWLYFQAHLAEQGIGLEDLLEVSDEEALKENGNENE